jgi:hypothetical protein
MKLMMLAAALAIGLFAAAPVPAEAQIRVVPPVVNPGRLAIRNANRTRFDPAVHGFRFANTFANNFIPEFDVRTGGLCGGMVFAALDYFNNPSVSLPTQDYEPGEGTALRIYLYHRQTNSIVDHNHVKWAEFGLNPFGGRNGEFYRWGLEGRLQEVKREIDAGRPVPLGLKGCNEGCEADHVVLAIGYDLGPYTGDPGNMARARQVKLFVYDPNFPGETMTLEPFPEASVWRYREADGWGVRRRWRTYFIAAYSPRNPPAVSQAPRELLLKLQTGGDDLRGGNDNLNIRVQLRSGRELSFDNVNNGRRWIVGAEQTVSLPLPAGVTPADVRGVVLETTFGGGFGGDNWDLTRIIVEGRGEGSPPGSLLTQTGEPLFRFTGDQRRRAFSF